jgi:hypothetical protein
LIRIGQHFSEILGGLASRFLNYLGGIDSIVADVAAYADGEIELLLPALMSVLRHLWEQWVPIQPGVILQREYLDGVFLQASEMVEELTLIRGHDILVSFLPRNGHVCWN